MNGNPVEAAQASGLPVELNQIFISKVCRQTRDCMQQETNLLLPNQWNHQLLDKNNVNLIRILKRSIIVFVLYIIIPCYGCQDPHIQVLNMASSKINLLCYIVKKCDTWHIFWGIILNVIFFLPDRGMKREILMKYRSPLSTVVFIEISVWSIQF